MQYRKFRWMLYAMTVVLTGVISLQVYWLNKAVLLEKKKFADQVHGAMMAATAKIESGEAFNLIAQNYLPPPPMPPGIEIRDCVITRNDTGKVIRIIHDRSVPGIPAPPPHTPPGTVMQFEINGPVKGSKDSLNSVVIMRGQRMKTAVKDALMQYVFTPDSAAQRTSRKEVEKALKESFKNAGLPENFEFAVKNHAGILSFLSDPTPETTNKLSQTIFHTPLFPSDRNPKGDELLVYINDHHNLIIRELWPQFVISLAFTILLILVFFMTFREALKQKKISEIRNDFINNMTHEFKTPIATISLAADTVMNEAVIHDPENVRKYSEIIKRENRRMNEQVEKVLELALTEKKELKLVYEPVDLNELLTRLISVMQLQIQSRKGKISFEKNENPVFINGDEFHLEKVFLNLLDNAIKYSSTNPEININLAQENENIVVEVKDNGIGIPADEQKRIFDRFYRVPTGDRHDVKGFGLGLSYVKSIVELHGGKTEVESKPGKGSTFRIIFKK